MAHFHFCLILYFETLCHAADITLKWDPNTEPDLEGYMLYYKTGSSGERYDFLKTCRVKLHI